MILGKLIPAGTGMKRYRNTRLNTDYIRHIKVVSEPEAIIDEEEELQEDILIGEETPLETVGDGMAPELEGELLETEDEGEETELEESETELEETLVPVE